MPTGPEPTFDPLFFQLLASLTTPAWQSADITDPSGTLLGRIVDSTGTHAHVGPAYNGAPGSVCWKMASSTGNGFYGMLMTAADAAKILASGAYISGGKLVSGGTTYNAMQCGYSERLVVFKLVGT